MPSINDALKVAEPCEHVKNDYAKPTKIETPLGDVLVCNTCREQVQRWLDADA